MTAPEPTTPKAMPRIAPEFHTNHFLRKNIFSILAWPVLALLLACLLWVLTLSALDREHDIARGNGMKQAASLARAYAQQLQRSVEELDRLTLNLKSDWEDRDIVLDLKRKREQRIYPAGGLYASILGRDGTLMTSTLEFNRSYNFSDEAHFRHHRADSSATLLISGPAFGRRIKKKVVRFSRRIETASGAFGGVAMIAVDPSFLAAFHDESMLGKNDFVSVRIQDGALLATKIGQSPGAQTVFYRDDPKFQGTAGVIFEPAEKFKDNVPRFIAWQKLDNYPLVALAGLSEANIFARYHATAYNYLAFATAGSVFLFLFATVGAAYSTRLAWRRSQEEEVKQTYRLAVDAAREGFYMLRPLYENNAAVDFEVVDCNARGAAMIGLTRADLLGSRFSDMHAGDYARSLNEKLQRALESGFYEDEERVPRQSMLKAAWVHRKLVRSGGCLALTIRDISDLKAHEQALTNMANADSLTALPNRHWLTNYLPLALEQARACAATLAVIFIDLDNFKNINDTLGHGAGDDLLKAAAARLRALIRASDHVVRVGGDEFIVILEGAGSNENIARVAQQIVTALSEPFTIGRSSGHQVHASAGISLFPRDGRDGDTLLKHADIAMYAAKAAGKGRYHFYHPHLSDRLLLRINREQALRQAIERDEFVLHYQPRVDTATGKLVSMEALVRWAHPERGMVPPGEFIETAEDTGLILQLGKIVIEKACAQMARWKADGLPVVPVSINVSALQFNEGNVKNVLASCMRRYGIEPDLIGVELTESCMAGEDDTVSGELDGLRELGVKLLVDDFGTGYSSLSQLQRLNVDVLKVDRAFTITLCEGDEGKALFKAIVSMADALDIAIVAEGVETAEQLDVLKSLDCDEVQGHFVSKPVPAGEMQSLMLKRFLFPPARESDFAVV
jgi:diguanylate cyclase (GGDEF)-like protein/PAS domain S-box-containing protein